MKSNGIIVIFGLILVAAASRPVSSRPQVISLRHPESTNYNPNHFSNSRPLNESRPPSLVPTRAKYSARPGDVVVHFDRNHEIQNLQYVLKNGQLATLYNRRGNGQVQPPTELHRRDDGASPSPDVVPSSQPPDEQLGMPYQPQRSTSPPLKQQQQLPDEVHEVKIDPHQTIEVLNSNQQGVSQLVGDHVTVPLPDLPYGTDEKLKLDVLATVAVDALHNGAQVGEAKLHKAGLMLDKLRSKVSKKLRELPGILDRRLRVKSSPGQLYLDKQGSKIVVIDDDGNQESGILPIDGIKTKSVEGQQQLIPIQLSPQRLDDSP